MTPERWEQVGKLYQAALALQPAERETFLDDACGDDKALRREVESLLAAEDGAGSFLAAGAMKDAAKLLPEELTANRDRLRRFEQEAQAASALNHPNIITIHEIGQVEGLNFIVTE